jgi:hypothetical protein
MLRAERAQAEDEEAWRAAESVARGAGPDGEAPLHDLELGIPDEPNRERRAAQQRQGPDREGAEKSAPPPFFKLWVDGVS